MVIELSKNASLRLGGGKDTSRGYGCWFGARIGIKTSRAGKCGKFSSYEFVWIFSFYNISFVNSKKKCC